MAASKKKAPRAAKGKATPAGKKKQATAKVKTAAKPSAKKAAAKRPALKKAAAKKPAAKKPAANKPAPKKPAAKKRATRATPKRASSRAETTADEDLELHLDDEQEATASLDEVLAEIDAVEETPLATRLAALDELQPRIYQLPEEDRAEAQSTLALAQQGCIDFAHTDPDARAAFLASVREAPWRTERVEQLAKFADAETYQLVSEQVSAQLATPYYKTQTSWLFALGGFARGGPFADEARALLLSGFERVVEHAQRKKELVNSVAFGALAYAAACVPHVETGPVLHRAFRIAAGLEDVRAHYELVLTCGPLAVAMSAVDHTAAIADIDAFATEKNELYPGDDFVMQCRYAQWLLAKDDAGAVAYVRDLANTKNLGLAAAALADLDAKHTRDALGARIETIEHPVAKEVFAEALTRLDAQLGPPAVTGRMIWMFGRKSSTEQALGSESDNVFVQRAVARTKNAELGVVYEADNSAPED